ncbi:MAG: hypothetical protein ABI127_04800 [Dokdonella sp.]
MAGFMRTPALSLIAELGDAPVELLPTHLPPSICRNSHDRCKRF